MTETLALPDPLARFRSRLAELEETRAVLQQQFDDITADAGDDTETWAQMQTIDAEIGRAQAAIAAAERNAAADARNRDAATIAKRRRDTEKAYGEYVDLALSFAAAIESAAALWPRVEAAYRKFEALTPETEATVFGSTIRPPAVMTRVMERYRQTLAPGRSASTDVRIEPLERVLRRKQSGLMSWLGM